MHMIDVIEFLKDQPLEDLDEFCLEFNAILAGRRLKAIHGQKALLNVGDLVKVKMGAPNGYVEMYVKKLNPKKAVCLRGDEHGRMVRYNVPYTMISEVSESVRSGNPGAKF